MELKRQQKNDEIVSPDNIWVLESLQLLQQRYLSQDGHGDAVLRQREVHRLQRHDLARLAVTRPVAIGADC